MSLECSNKINNAPVSIFIQDGFVGRFELIISHHSPNANDALSTSHIPPTPVVHRRWVGFVRSGLDDRTTTIKTNIPDWYRYDILIFA